MKTDCMKKETDKWEDRHFQVCLAIISRTETDMYGHTKTLNFQDIINKADRMVSLLKERYTTCVANCETIGNREKFRQK